jgi:hypothetical protein
MPDAKVVPGQTGQPEKSDLQDGLYYDSMGAVHTTSPSVNQYLKSKGSPGQDPDPFENKAWSNDSQKPAFPRSSNDINGGGDMFDMEADVTEAP